MHLLNSLRLLPKQPRDLRQHLHLLELQSLLPQHHHLLIRPNVLPLLHIPRLLFINLYILPVNLHNVCFFFLVSRLRARILLIEWHLPRMFFDYARLYTMFGWGCL